MGHRARRVGVNGVLNASMALIVEDGLPLGRHGPRRGGDRVCMATLDKSISNTAPAMIVGDIAADAPSIIWAINPYQPAVVAALAAGFFARERVGRRSRSRATAGGRALCGNWNGGPARGC